MRFRGLLLKLAQGGTHRRYRHAAVIAKGKAIYGVGVNTDKVHAEVAAIGNALGTTQGCTLYTLMVRRDGSLGNGAPCQECMDAIAQARIRKVVVYV